MITVGCSGFAVPATRYFKEYEFVEVQETHRAVPGPGTIRRWRREAPDGFQFALLGPREIAQESFRSGKVIETALKSLTGEKKAGDSDKSAAKADKAPQTRSYTVTGATLTLQLPDRRLVRVTCESKYSLRFDYINRRSCRTPPADEVTAEFNGNEAKLIWSVSLDNRKTQSETYTILNIVPSRR